jgi:hypothetical protein
MVQYLDIIPLEWGVGSGVLPAIRPKALEGWPNTAAPLAGWRRVTQPGVILYLMDGPCHLP